MPSDPSRCPRREARRQTARRIFDLVRSGQSIRKTAETMTAETSRTWRPTDVDRIVRREVYKLREPGRIVDPRVWNAAHDALASRRRRQPS